ncbi:MAG: hypothetical protein JSV95_09140 [Gemmatimonadota bacterium]|jgi:hypothetical protein|nr:MAG: hypothetical protein JSV95_09140 [Gemmatimonadota bacterium]
MSSSAAAVVAIGSIMLAACARQAVIGSRESPHRSAPETHLRSDLEALQSAQEHFRTLNDRYTNRLGELEFSPSRGVQVSIVQGDRRGYSAIAATAENECAVFGGEARPPRSYVTRPGLVGCRL